MVTAIVVAVLVMTVVAGLLDMASKKFEESMLIGLAMGVIVGFLVPLWIGFKISYTPDIKIQPMVSIYTNQSENEIYLKAISGSQLIYRIDEEGVPREHTVSTDSVKEIKIEDISPYLEITTYLFKEEWYKYFVFSPNSDEYIFHVPQTGVEVDINYFLE